MSKDAEGGNRVKLAPPDSGSGQRRDRRHTDLDRPSTRPSRDQVPLGEALVYVAEFWGGLKPFLSDG